MKIEVFSEIVNKEEIQVNQKGCEELDIDYRDISTLSLDSSARYIGIKRDLYRMTNKSYKNLKKQLQKENLLYRFDYGKQKR